jgi:CubicO group peptidase (beta-lactamase class C family)
MWLACLLALGIGLLRNDARTVRALDGHAIPVEQIDVFLHAQMASLGLPGLSIAVVNDGATVYHRTLGLRSLDSKDAVTEDTLFDAGSMSKTPFAVFVMRMVERGLLDLDRPLYTYLPNADIAYDDRYRSITARMVLSHTSGLPNWRSLNADGRLDIKFTPGTQYLYSGEGFEYLADVVAHLAGVGKNGLQDLFAKDVAVPLGMRDAYYTWNDYVASHQASGHIDGRVAKGWGMSAAKPGFGAAYSLQTEAVSYARFVSAMIRGEGLRKETYDTMLEARVKTPTEGVSYGLGIMVRPSRFGTDYLHDGYNQNFSSAFMFNRERRFGYVFFTNCNRGMEFNRRLEPFLTTGEK